MDKPYLLRLREELRRQTTSPKMLEYLDGTLTLLQGPQDQGCPVCADRREKKARAMRKWRARASQS